MLDACMDRWLNNCKECGRLVEIGHRHLECEAKHQERERARWDEKVEERERSGLCPRCGERPVLPGAKSCQECGLGEKELNPKKVGIDALVDQFGRFLKKHKRLFYRHYDPEPEPKRKHRKKSPPPEP
jgi:hypothetical protein